MNIYNKLQERREEIMAIAAKHGAYNIRVFGSVARHEADLASDIDLLVGAKGNITVAPYNRTKLVIPPSCEKSSYPAYSGEKLKRYWP